MTIDGVELLEVREAAAMAGRTPETIRRWVWSGRLAARKHGNRLLIARSALEELDTAGAGTDRLTLAKWAGLVAQRRAGQPGGPGAADLVLDDRRARTEEVRGERGGEAGAHAGG